MSLSKWTRLIPPIILVAALLFGVYSWQKTKQASVVVEWTTASELDTVGFNLYRSQDPAGHFTQVNTSLIPAANDPLAGSSYHYTDDSVQPGQTYYYELEDVDQNGATSRFGPIEVKAQNSGMLELGLSLALALLALVVWIAGRRQAVASAGGPAGSMTADQG